MSPLKMYKTRRDKKVSATTIQATKKGKKSHDEENLINFLLMF